MKKYLNFLKEELDIKDTQGLPSDIDKLRKDYTKYTLSSIPDSEQSAREYGKKVMELSQKNRELIGTDPQKKDELKKLAEDIIRNYFQELLNYIKQTMGAEVVFNFEFSNDIVGQMTKLSSKPEKAPNEIPQDMPEDQKSKISKAKILDMMGQSAGFDVSGALDDYPELSTKITKILGKEKTDEFIQNTKDTMNWAQRLDQAENPDTKARMMKTNPSGMAGGNDVRFDKENKKIIISVKGIDFVMLIHEGLKGVNRLLSWASSQDSGIDPKPYTSSYRDEVDDFRYGPVLKKCWEKFVEMCVSSSEEYSQMEFKNLMELIWVELSRSKENGGRYRDDEFLTMNEELLEICQISNDGKVTIEKRQFDRSVANPLIMEIIKDIVSKNQSGKPKNQGDPIGEFVKNMKKYTDDDNWDEIEREEKEFKEWLEGLPSRDIEQYMDDILDKNPPWKMQVFPLISAELTRRKNLKESYNFSRLKTFENFVSTLRKKPDAQIAQGRGWQMFLERFNRIFKSLSPDKKQEINSFFN